MKNEKRVACSHICIDCVSNDPVDIRCGGPEFLGFDFFVKCEDVDYMQQVIMITFNQIEMPFKKMTITGPFNKKVTDVWTRDRIVKTILRNAENFKFEERRNYGSSR